MHELGALDQRFARLEKGNRRLRSWNAVLLALVGLSVLTGLHAPQDRRLEVEQLVVTDEAGVERASLGLVDGSVSLDFRNPKGRVVAGFGLSSGREDPAVPEGRPILYMGSHGKPEVSLRVGEDMDGEAWPSLALSNWSLEAPVHARLDARKDRAGLSILTFGPGGIWGVISRVDLTASTDGFTVLRMRDKEGEPILELPSPHEAGRRVQWDVPGTTELTRLIRDLPKGSRAQFAADCRGPRVSDRTLELLAGVPGLISVTLRACPNVTDQGVRELAGVSSLRTLWVLNCHRLGEGGLAALDGNKTIDTLSLSSVPMTRECIDRIASMRSLRELRLTQNPELRDEWLESLCGLTGLESLDLRRCSALTSEGVARLRDCLGQVEVLFDD